MNEKHLSSMTPDEYNTYFKFKCVLAIFPLLLQNNFMDVKDRRSLLRTLNINNTHQPVKDLLGIFNFIQSLGYVYKGEISLEPIVKFCDASIIRMLESLPDKERIKGQFQSLKINTF